MNIKYWLTFSLLFVCLLGQARKPTQKKIIFLYQGQKQLDRSTLSQIQKNHNQYPIFTVDCNKADCNKYKATQYPALIFWNGPGTSFKKLNPPNNQGLQNYFLAQSQHPLKNLRDFMDQFQSFGVAIIVATVLYFVFSFLFKDRTGLQYAKTRKDL